MANLLKLLRGNKKKQIETNTILHRSDLPLRDFIYLDWERVRSYSAQLFKGIPENATQETGREGGLTANMGGDIPLFIKGEISSDYRYFRKENETKSFHHYIYTLLEEKLKKSNMLLSISSDFDENNWRKESFHDGQFVIINGIIRLSDYKWAMGTMEALPKMMQLVVNVSKFDNDKARRDAQDSLRQMKTWDIKEITELIRTLYGENIRIKITYSKSYPQNVITGIGIKDYFYDSVNSLIQKYGYEVDANWYVLGQINISTSESAPLPLPMGNTMEDSLEQVILAMNALTKITSSIEFPAISITPISIYRIIN